VTDILPAPQDRYDEAVAEHGDALVRLARSYERDPDRQRDLLQDIHFALWRSFASFDGRCALRTWVYRVAHNAAASHALRDRRYAKRTLVSLEAIEPLACTTPHDADEDDERLRLEQLARMLEQLKPLDRQLVLLYLEGLDATSIGAVTGLSSANVATKIHRIKRVLATRARTGAHDAR
jgi:RNA polymerase sigma-70 factor (ECF subfamily)